MGKRRARRQRPTLVEHPPQDPLPLDANLAAAELAPRTEAAAEERPRLRRIDE